MLILVGGFNERTKAISYFIVNDSIDHIFQDANDYPSDQFDIPRKSKDSSALTMFGRSPIDLSRTFNDMVNGDADGNFTCFAND